MQIPQITFTRFLAAVSIVFLHYGLFSWPMNTPYLSTFGGDLISAMSYFFILSGFIMVVSSAKNSQFPDKINSLNYWKRRAARILPVYWLAMIIFFAVNFRYDPTIPLDWQIQSYYNSIFLLQSWKYRMALDVNYPAWSLSVEALFYFIFPWLYANLKQLKNKQHIVLSVIAWSLNYYIYISLKAENVPANFLHYFPLLHVATFLTGMSAGFLLVNNYQFLKEKAKIYIYSITAFATVFVIYTAFNNFDFYNDQHNGLMSPYYLLVIFSLALTSGKIADILGSKIPVFFGDISYSVYILQFPVYQIAQKYLPWFKDQKPEVMFLPYLMLLIVVSSVVYLFFEKPIRVFLTRKKTVPQTTNI
jgi:peptidoglycan/LPS O-acetylase OafA/YrhL